MLSAGAEIDDGKGEQGQQDHPHRRGDPGKIVADRFFALQQAADEQGQGAAGDEQYLRPGSGKGQQLPCQGV